MFKRIFIICVLLAILVPIGTVVAKDKEPIGSPINVLAGTPTAFASNSPFHIKHGFIHEEVGQPLGAYDFELYVDGVLHEEDFVLRNREPGPNGQFTILWVHNFPDGMTGSHTFVGRWYEPCNQFAADPSTCATPNERTLALTRTLDVFFGTP